MGVGLSGMISGLDTDSIVQAMVSTQTSKKEKIEGNIQKNKWTTEAWSDLNKKIYSFYTTYASKLRLKSSYMTRSATSSDENAVKVSASSTAAVGSHTLEVKALASSQYVTGAKLSGSASYTTSTKLSSIDSDLVGTTITIKGNAGTDDEKEVSLTIDSNTKISDFTDTLKKAGLSANFDTNQRRFFISSSDSGADNKFTITSSKLTSASSSALSTISGKVDTDKLTSDEKTAWNSALDTISANTDKIDTVTADDFDYENATDTEKAVYDAIKTVKDTAASQTAAADAASYVDGLVDTALANGTDLVLDETTYSYSDLFDAVVDADSTLASLDDYKAANPDDTKTDEEYEADYKTALTAALKTQLESTEGYTDNYDKEVSDQTTVYENSPTDNMETVASDIDSALASLASSGTEAGPLSSLGLGEIDGTAHAETTDASGNKSMVVVAAQDSEVVLDGATMTGSGNTVTINGLTIDVIAETSSPVTVSVTKDTDSIYNTIKEALKEYNTLLDEMNTLYSADSARSYSVLTDDEKEEMSDDEVEEWNNKIKSALLRNDTSLGSLLTSMRSSLQKTYTTTSGNTYSLASFGITTGTYTEKGKLHIYGDSDDSTYATYDDRLKAALNDNPDDVMEALSGIFSNLYTTMTEKCAKTSLSSALTFYNDKQYSTQLSTYEDQLEDIEDRISTLEDRYYDQFTSMETALSELQSQTSSLSSMLGTSSS